MFRDFRTKYRLGWKGGAQRSLFSGVVQDAFVLTATTVGAVTLTLNGMTVATGKTVTVAWGDGLTDTYTAGAGARTHNYAGAGTYTVRMGTGGGYQNITVLDLRDTKLSGSINANNRLPTGMTSLTIISLANLTWAVGAAAPMPTGLTYLYLQTLAGLTWAVGAAAPMPTGLTTLYLVFLTGLTWAVGASAPMPTGLTFLYLDSLAGLTWAVGASAPMPTGLTFLYLFNLTGLTPITVWTGINAIRAIQYESSLTQPQVDAVLLNIWNNKANFTWATPTLDLLGGSNAAPSGVYASVCPPTTGKEYAYDLVNGVCTASGPEWTVTTL